MRGGKSCPSAKRRRRAKRIRARGTVRAPRHGTSWKSAGAKQERGGSPSATRPLSRLLCHHGDELAEAPVQVVGEFLPECEFRLVVGFGGAAGVGKAMAGGG